MQGELPEGEFALIETVKRVNALRSATPKVPRKVKIDWELVAKLAGMLCTQNEIAFACGTTAGTLKRWCPDDMGCPLDEYISDHASGGKASLRRLQWVSAQGKEGVPMKDKDGNTIKDDKGKIQWSEYPMYPNVTMQIFLGKQYLEQKDREMVDHTVKGTVLSLTADDYELASRLAKAEDKVKKV